MEARQEERLNKEIGRSRNEGSVINACPVTCHLLAYVIKALSNLSPTFSFLKHEMLG